MSTEVSAPVFAGMNSLVLNPAMMEQVALMADRMAAGRVTVPDHLKGNPGDCYAIALQALQWGMNPFSVAQKTFLVQGRLGYEAQLVNAVIIALAPIKGRLRFEWFGPWEKILGKFETATSRNGNQYRKAGWKPEDEVGCGVRCSGVLRGEDEPRELELLLTQAATRNSTLWAEDPRQQLAYLATKRWARLYCPEVILGVYSADELEAAPVMRDVTPPPASAPAEKGSRTSQVKEKLRKARAVPAKDEPAIVEGEQVVEVVDENTLDGLLSSIEACDTEQALVVLSADIAAFLHAGDNEKHRGALTQAFAARRDVVRSSQAESDEDFVPADYGDEPEVG